MKKPINPDSHKLHKQFVTGDFIQLLCFCVFGKRTLAVQSKADTVLV